MKRLTTLILAAALLLCAMPANANDDPCVHFMRNNFDALAIGEITVLGRTMCVIRVDSTIVSARGDRAQLSPKRIELRLDTEGYDHDTLHYIGNRDAKRQVGDFVLLAATKIKNSGQFEGFMYKIDSMDKQTLTIQTHEDASSSFRCECKMIEDFVHSDGQNTEFERRIDKETGAEQVYRFPTQKHREEDKELIFEVPATTEAETPET